MAFICSRRKYSRWFLPTSDCTCDWIFDPSSSTSDLNVLGLVIAFAELFLNGLHLLAQKVLALVLADLRLHLRLDLRSQLEHFRSQRPWSGHRLRRALSEWPSSARAESTRVGSCRPPIAPATGSSIPARALPISTSLVWSSPSPSSF